MTDSDVSKDITELREGIISYMLTRATPWQDEAEMRAAVNATVGIIFNDAFSQTRRIVEQIDAS